MAEELSPTLKADFLKGQYALQREAWEKAEKAFRAVLRQNPVHVGSLLGLSQVAAHFEHHAAAWQLLQQALQQEPNHEDCLFAAGNAQRELGDIPTAIDFYQKILVLNPQHAAALNNLAALTTELGQFKVARHYLERALAQFPEEPRLLQNVGLLHAREAEYSKASNYFYRSLKANPAQPHLFHLLGRSLEAQGDLNQAGICYQGALTLVPDSVDYQLELARHHLREYRLDFARFHYQKAVELEPECAAAYEGLARIEAESAQPAAALSWLEQALALFPENEKLYSRWLVYALADPENVSKTWMQRVQQWNKQWGQPQPVPRFKQNRDPQRPLKIGYTLTPWLYYHQPYDCEYVLTHYDRNHFQPLVLLHGIPRTEIIEWLTAQAIPWQSIQDWSNEQVVDYCRSQSLDILVDLAGHSGENQLSAWALNPAPVVIIGPGVNHTTGLNVTRMTDAWLTPPTGRMGWSSEKLEWIKAARCWKPPLAAPELNPLPLLQQGVLTLGYHGPLWQLNDSVFAAWVNILKQLPRSHLWLCIPGVTHNAVRKMILEGFGQLGLVPERLQLSEPQDWPSRGHFYQQLDILLESFPQSDWGALAEAVWQGVPFVAIGKGRRWGCALLGPLGLTNWMALHTKDYVAKVVKLANQPTTLQHLRRELRGKLLQSGLCDPSQWVADVESHYRQLWQQWCQTDSGQSRRAKTVKV